MSLSAAGPARGLLLSALFALFLPAFAALAEAPVPSVPSAVPGQPHTYYPQGLPAQAAEPAPAASLLPPLSVTEHTLRLAGGDLRYTAKAGPLPLRDGKGEISPRFSTSPMCASRRIPSGPSPSYSMAGRAPRQPICILAPSGPKAIAASDKGEVLGPPPRLSDNESSWLAFTDLVFVDPVGTGYSRVGARKEEKDFFGVEQDTEALADFIRLYLIDAGRVASPVFVAGESYGGFRAATITRQLQKTGGVSPSGIVLISPALEFSLLHADDYDPLPWALALPSFAAVNLEKKGVAGREALAEGLKEAQRYALSDYLVALASGVEEGGKTASETVARLTGLPLPLVERQSRTHLPLALYQGVRPRERQGAEPLRRRRERARPASVEPMAARTRPGARRDRASLDRGVRPICARVSRL